MVTSSPGVIFTPKGEIASIVCGMKTLHEGLATLSDEAMDNLTVEDTELRIKLIKMLGLEISKGIKEYSATFPDSDLSVDELLLVPNEEKSKTENNAHLACLELARDCTFKFRYEGYFSVCDKHFFCLAVMVMVSSGTWKANLSERAPKGEPFVLHPNYDEF